MGSAVSVSLVMARIFSFVSALFATLFAMARAMLFSSSIEDEFHAAKAGAGCRTLTARLCTANADNFERLVTNLKSRRTDNAVAALAVASPQFSDCLEVKDVLAGKHAALVVRMEPERRIVEIDIDHRYGAPHHAQRTSITPI